jgi:hypothetical protein
MNGWINGEKKEGTGNEMLFSLQKKDISYDMDELGGNYDMSIKPEIERQMLHHF